MRSAVEPTRIAFLFGASVLLASCRGCLETEVQFAGEGGGSTGNGTSTSVGTPTPASSGATSDVSSTDSSADSSSSSSSSGSGGATSSGGANGGGGSGGGEIPCTELESFAEDELRSCWGVLHGSSASEAGIDSGAHNYFVVPRADSGWWQYDDEDDLVGYFLHREVSGPFVVSVHVQAAAPSGTLQMAGLFLRDPTSAQESWLKWEIGRRGDLANEGVGGGGGEGGGDPEVLYGSIAGANTEGLPARWLPGGHAINGYFIGRLGICRNGADYFMYYRPDTGSWQLGHQFSAPSAAGVAIPDLPDQVQVGMIANAFGAGDPSLVAGFDNFVLTDALVESDDDCVAELEAQMELFQ